MSVSQSLVDVFGCLVLSKAQIQFTVNTMSDTAEIDTREEEEFMF